eukprot:g4779.t1
MLTSFLKFTKKKHGVSGKNRVQFLESEIVGRDASLQGPFGRRRIVYCDYTASGRALGFVERFIFKKVLPYYANTHTEASYTGKYISSLREAARESVREFVNADDSYAVVFVGDGTTGAVNRLFHVSGIAQREDVTIILGPYEHHATIMPTVAAAADVVRIRLAENGSVDVSHLKSVLECCSKEKKKPIGIFSAVSNVTGVVTEPNDITRLVHKYDGLCFWDYASGAPYLEIDVGGSNAMYSKDAIFFSPHKMIGGVSTPGILVAKKSLFVNEVPGNVGGGSVAYVTNNTHAFKKSIEEREESGTPNIVGSIRVGLILALRATFLSHSEVEQREDELTKHTTRVLQSIPNLHLLGNMDLIRLPTFSFIVRHQRSRLALHHHFVCTLLSDLFGIQSRSGCMCAGPYSQTLLSISDEDAEAFLPFLETKQSDQNCPVEEIMKPGYVRLNFIYFLKDNNVEFILEALKFVAEHGWKFLPAYKFDVKTGYWSFSPKATVFEWKCRNLENKNLPFLKYNNRQENCIEYAQGLAMKINRHWFNKTNVQGAESMSEAALEKKWFLLPSEAISELQLFHLLS